MYMLSMSVLSTVCAINVCTFKCMCYQCLYFQMYVLSMFIPSFYIENSLKQLVPNYEGADDVKDAVIHGKVERIMCSEFEAQLDNGHQKTAGIIWTMGKVLTGSVFDGGGYCCWTNRQERAL